MKRRFFSFNLITRSKHSEECRGLLRYKRLNIKNLDSRESSCFEDIRLVAKFIPGSVCKSSSKFKWVYTS